ncbi:MAG: DoxX family protein [Candidatus Margulisiibacteriota bacterium]
MLNKVSRLLFSLPFIILGAMHFLNGPNMVGLVPSYVPGAIFWVYFVGACLVAAGVSVNIGKKDGLAMRLLAILLVIFALTIFLPMVLGGNQMAMSSLLKDLGLAGAALFFSENAIDKS